MAMVALTTSIYTNYVTTDQAEICNSQIATLKKVSLNLSYCYDLATSVQLVILTEEASSVTYLCMTMNILL